MREYRVKIKGYSKFHNVWIERGLSAPLDYLKMNLTLSWNTSSKRTCIPALNIGKWQEPRDRSRRNGRNDHRLCSEGFGGYCVQRRPCCHEIMGPQCNWVSLVLLACLVQQERNDHKSTSHRNPYTGPDHCTLLHADTWGNGDISRVWSFSNGLPSSVSSCHTALWCCQSPCCCLDRGDRLRGCLNVC